MLNTLYIRNTRICYMNFIPMAQPTHFCHMNLMPIIHNRHAFRYFNLIPDILNRNAFCYMNFMPVNTEQTHILLYEPYSQYTKHTHFAI